ELQGDFDRRPDAVVRHPAALTGAGCCRQAAAASAAVSIALAGLRCSMSRVLIAFSLVSVVVLSGCVAPAPKPDDPYYAPVLPRTPLPAAQNNGAIYQAGFETSLFDDRKAFRVGDIITITPNERTQASKNSNSKISKDSSANIGLGSLFGGAVSM